MKRKFYFLDFVVLAMMLSLGVGCAKKLDDAKMSSDIQSRFSQDSGLSSKQLTVQANNGVVTLSGTVDNEPQREAAARQAAAVSGVKTVINNLQVADSSAAMASASPKPDPGDTSNAAASPAPSAPAETRPAKVKKARHSRHADDSGAGSPQDPQQMAENNPPPNNPAPQPPADNPAPAPPPPAPKKLIIDQGTQLTVRLVDPIDSEKNQTGETFHATLNVPLTSDGEQAVPAGVELVGHLVSVKSAGKFAGSSEVVLQLDTLTSGGRTYNLQTDQYRKTGSSRGKNTAEKVGGGAVIGSIIGAIAGGGKGAAIGAAAGAGVGGGVQAATKGQQIKLPSETVLNFTLQAPITVVQASSDARQKLNDSQQQ